MEQDNTIWQQLLLNKIATVMEQEDDGYYTVYRMNCPDGHGIRRVYRVFPGLDLAYDEMDTSDFSCIERAQPHEKISRNVMEISYCREGRLECEFQNGLYVYMGKGDFFAGMVDVFEGITAFPMEGYQGISIYIYADTLSRRAPQLFEEVSVDISGIHERLSRNGMCFGRAKDQIERIFLDLYRAPESIGKFYLELKVTELLLLLGIMDFSEKNEPPKYYPRQHVEIIKRIQEQITNDIRGRHTIDGLSAEHGISRTALKSCFKGVYGVPIATYIKTYRMKSAAVMLRQTNSSVSDIAFRVGYENQSKFAAAFKEFSGMSPLGYRKSVV